MDVAIIKYNAGNIYSVDYALKRLGVTPIITADPELLNKADKVIFPGVGEAFTTMEYLREHKLDLEPKATGTRDMPRHAIDVHAFGGGKRRLLGDLPYGSKTFYSAKA